MSNKSKASVKSPINVQKCQTVSNYGMTVADLASILLKGLNGQSIAPNHLLVISDGVDSIRPVRSISIGRKQRIGSKLRFNAELRGGRGNVVLLH